MLTSSRCADRSILKNFLLYIHSWSMFPSDNVSMSVGHLDHVLTVYSSMEHVTWKSPGPMCGWGSCVPIHAYRCLRDPKCLLYPCGLSLCFYVDHCLVPVDDMVLFHGMVCDGWPELWLVSYIVLPCYGRDAGSYQLSYTWDQVISRSRAPSSCKKSTRDQDVPRTPKRCH